MRTRWKLNALTVRIKPDERIGLLSDYRHWRGLDYINAEVERINSDPLRRVGVRETAEGLVIEFRKGDPRFIPPLGQRK